MNTGIVPILKVLNERLTCLDHEDIDPALKMSVKLELNQARTHLKNARSLLQIPDNGLPKHHRNSA